MASAGRGASGGAGGTGSESKAGASAGGAAAGSGMLVAGMEGMNAAPAVAGYLRTDGAKLVDSEGRQVRLAGVNWFGLETENFAPFGLANRPLAAFLDQIEALGFNVIRLPYCNQLFDSGSRPMIGGTSNRELEGSSGLELLDAIIEGAGQRGLKIILDRHRPDSTAQSELWYTSRYSEQRWIDDWKMLAMRYASDPTVIAADLHNEPRGMATWGDGNMATDWKAAAERAGNAILAVNPNWLIIVEGIEKVGSDYYWWGGNLKGVEQHPVVLSIPNRVVYSTHDYPSSLYPQAWFSGDGYPANLASVWSSYWGYIAERNIAPVFVGEFGTKLQTESDKQWLGALTSYIGQHELSWTFWTLNPNSDDTGGILQDDWMTVETEKMTALMPILAGVRE